VKKILVIVGACLVLFIVLLASAWWWLTATRSGAEWALDRASSAVSTLQWESLEGDLRSGLVVRNLELKQAGSSVRLAEVELAVRISLPPAAAIDVDWLRVKDGQIQLPAPAPEAATDEPLKLPDLRSPIPIRIHELALNNLLIQPAAAEEPPIEVNSLRLLASIDDQLDLQTLEIRLPDLRAAVSGTLALNHPFQSNLSVNVNAQFGDGIEHALAADLRGDIETMTVDLSATGPGEIAGSIEIVDPLGELDVNAALAGRLSGWADLDLGVEDIKIDVEGSPQAWQLILSGRVVGADIPENQWRFDLNGDLERVRIRQGNIATLDGELNLQGDIDLAAGPQAVIRLTASDINPSEFVPDWPDTVRLAGSLDLTGDPTRAEFNNLELSAPPTALSLTGSGQWHNPDQVLGLNLNWRDLAWPPQSDGSPSLFQSRSGSLRISGPLSEWQLELESLIKLLDQPELKLNTQAGGNQSTISINRLVADAGAAGRLEAAGSIQIQPEPSGDLDLRLNDLDTGRFFAEFPGLINADLGLAFQAPDALSIKVRALDGQLRDQPLSGQGEVALRREQPQAGRLVLALGDNQLTLGSDDGNAWEIGLKADALRQLMPSIDGQLDLSGTIDLASGSAQWRGVLADAGYGDIVMRRATIESGLEWRGDRPAGHLVVEMSDLDLNPWDRIEELELSLQGYCDEHQGQLNLISQRGSLDLGLSGAVNSCAPESIDAWAGRIERLYLGNTIAGDWSLDQPLEITASVESIQTGNACLVETAKREGRLCLNRLDVGNGGQIELAIAQLPMDLLLAPLDPVFNLTTPLSGEVLAGWGASGGVDELVGELRLGQGVLQPLGAETSLLGIDSVRLAFEPEAEFLKISLNALLEGDSRLNGQARLLDLQDLSSATIDADARVSLPDIGVFNRLVTDLDQLGGRLTSEVQFSGALLAPTLDGHLELNDGLIVNAPIGLRIEDIALRLEGTEDSASLTGNLRSGEGQATVSGELDMIDDQWQLEAAVAGENFAFANVDWLQLRASPDIRLQRAPNGLTTINGDIRIDHLRAGVPPGAAERINASDDVRVRGEVDEEEEGSAIARQLQGRLGLDLGDDARLAALGMQARLAGGLELQWDRSRIEPQATGVIRIPEGSYRAYGQNLEIEDGEIVFTGHAVDNPSLDIEAVREIFGDPQVEQAGVRIRGNARDPRISLFTDPPTSEEKALAYVVTGANFDHASGQAAVNIGFYLLPRLFVSYGIGLFEAGNVLSGRYELSQRWGVRVVSGERDTGVDLSYAIDR
jgi:translocation and assembly module TamB